MVRVFITGGSGLIGSVTIPALVSAGNEVTALSRTEKSAESLRSKGVAHIVQGTIDNFEVLRSAASHADAVIHLACLIHILLYNEIVADYEAIQAFDHAMMFTGNAAGAMEKDTMAISIMCDALIGNNNGNPTKTFIYASGVLGLSGPDEKSEPIRIPQIPRWKSEDLVLAYSKKGLRTVSMRFAAVVHTPIREHRFISSQIDKAKECGYVGYVEEGSPVLAAVNVDDIGPLVALALAKAPSGVCLHGVAEGNIPTKDIAELIAAKLNMKIQVVEKKDAFPHWGFAGMAVSNTQHITSNLTKEWTGWQPKGYGLLEQMERNYKF